MRILTARAARDRSHLIRMPVHLLAHHLHLGRNAFFRPKKPDNAVVID